MTITEPTSPAASGPTALDEPIPPSAPPPVEPPVPAADDDAAPRRRRRISRHGWITAGIGVVAAALYTWNLAANGYGNDYYSAAVLSATQSWKAFFFGSIDSVGAITVDKPPLALWVQALSARVFGFSSWSILLPQAAAGVASVLVLHHLVRRWAGDVAAHLAAVALAVTPVALLMFRYNNPDAVLTLLGLASAWAIWKAVETGRTRWLVVCGTFVGLAFTTKMLQALVVLPALGLVYLIAGPPKIGRRLLQLLAAGVALVVSAGWWIAVVALWPADDRPYIGSTSDNSILSLVFGYNGLSRVLGGSGAGSGAGPVGGSGGGPNFGGAAGWLRLFNAENGGQISWLLPLAAAGLLAGLWLTRRRPRTDPARAGWILWGGWAVVGTVLFSRAQGIFHPYYSVQLAPAIAALAGAGAIALWRLGRTNRWLSLALPAAVLARAAWAVALLLATPDFAPWLRPVIVLAAVVASVGLLVGGSLRSRRLVAAAAVAAAIAVLAGPTAYSLATVSASSNGPVVNAGPASATSGAFGGMPGSAGLPGNGSAPEMDGMSGIGDGGAGVTMPDSAMGPGVSGAPRGPGGSRTADTALVAYLEANRGDADYLAAAFSSNGSAPLILATGGEAVLTIGGFNGSDPYPTVDQLTQLVADGELRFVVMDGEGAGGRPGGFGGGPDGGNQTTQAVREWVVANGTAVAADAYGGTGTQTVYDLSDAV
jgi:4-amino-4-deoxy-L-arabinose transferase-like glycosyltransferase